MTGSPLPGPFGPPRAWDGADLAADDGWIHRLRADEIDELVAAAEASAAAGGSIESVTREAFALPTLTATIDGWADELDAGRGLVMVRGVPVERLDAPVVEHLYAGLGAHLGVAVSQNTDGDLLGHVRDDGSDPNDPDVRLYRTRAAQPFHTDGSDVVGLLCRSPSARGGESTVVSSVAVWDRLRAEHPDVAALLLEDWSFDLHGQAPDGFPGFFDAPIYRVVDGRLHSFYLPWYITQAVRHEDAIPLTEDRVAALATLDRTCQELSLAIDFRPGDIQLISNASIFHGRAAYEDDPAAPRHLLRLWLTLWRNAPDGKGAGGIDAI